MEKKKLICVVGETKSGKDNTVGIAELLSRDFGDDIQLNEIRSYTTRPKRDNEENGREHFFISEERARELLANNEVLAYTKIEDPESGNKGYEYFTLLSQLDYGNIYIIDPKGIESLEKHRDKIDFISVYIHSPFFIRRFRARHFSDFKSEYFARVLNERKQFREFRKKKKYDYRIENIQWFSYIAAFRFYLICKNFLSGERK